MKTKTKQKSGNKYRVARVDRPTAMQKIYDYMRSHPDQYLTESQVRRRFKVKNPRATMADIRSRLLEDNRSVETYLFYTVSR